MSTVDLEGIGYVISWIMMNTIREIQTLNKRELENNV